jgi:Uma2 family endonuclease
MAAIEAREIQGEIIAQDVTFADYMAHYAAAHTEWVEGMVIKMSSVSAKHDTLFQFLIILLRAYLRKTQTGTLKVAPFVMKITPESPAREPDLHIVLKERAGIIQDTMTAGAADVVVEIVSPESEKRDMVEKYYEYQAGGVREYWLVNPQRRQADFYVLGDDGLYQRIELHDGVFRSRALPEFVLDTTVLWDDAALEDDERIRALVDTMLA